jgi:hypothetical protein
MPKLAQKMLLVAGAILAADLLIPGVSSHELALQVVFVVAVGVADRLRK